MATVPAPTALASGSRPRMGWRAETAAFLAGLAAMWAVVGGTVEHFQVLACLLTAIAWSLSDADAALAALVGAVAIALVGAWGSGAPATLAPLKHLGNDTTVLIVAAFVVAKAIERSGLALSLTAGLLGRRAGALAYGRLGLAAFVATFLVPSTAARASVLLPVVEGAASRAASRGEQRAIALMVPLVILLAAVGSPIAAGANLLAIQLLAAQTGIVLSFVDWVILGAPFALASTLLAVALPWAMLRHDRRPPEAAPAEAVATPATGEDRAGRNRVALVVAVVVGLWTTTGLHPFDPTLVALVGAMFVTLPGFGVLTLPDALKSIDWALIILLAASAQIGDVIGTSPLVASWVTALGDGLTRAGPLPISLVVAVLALAAMLSHLVIASRSARAAMLLPAFLALALPLGLDPVVAALTVTAGTGFCILTPVGSKALLVFARSGSPAAISRDDLQDVGRRLLPLQLGLTVAFATAVWPFALGGR